MAGILKLSLRQAEGRRGRLAVLCLLYFFTLGLLTASAAFFPAPGGAGFAALLVAAVCVKGLISREGVLLSQGYLNRRREDFSPPPVAAAIAAELAGEAFTLTAGLLLLCPAALCLRAGVRYYSLSADRRGLLPLLAASLLLAAGGLLFSWVIRCRLCCAGFLRLSGKCGGVPAMDASWELTRGSGGDLLRLSLAALFFGPVISALCKANASRILLRRRGNAAPGGLRVGLVRDGRGELSVELTEGALTGN